MSKFDPNYVMRNLINLFPLVYTALDYGVMNTKDFFGKQENQREDMAIDPYLAPNLVRYHAINYLRKVGQDVDYDSLGNSYNIEKIPNNGIHINHGQYQIKILKSNNGDLPVPGQSKSRRDYYCQPNLFSGEDDVSDVRLLLMWNVDHQYCLDVLSLACPKFGGTRRDSVMDHWHCPIPKKLLYGNFRGNVIIPNEEIYDLDIENLDIDKTGTDYSK
jgi:hypothetical protein